MDKRTWLTFWGHPVVRKPHNACEEIALLSAIYGLSLYCYHITVLFPYCRRLWSSLPRDVAQSVACAIIKSRLDYCNSLKYYGCQTLIFKGAECCCTNCLPSTTTPTLLSRPSYKDLHWLSVRGRIDYKIAVLCYKAVKLRQPSYLLLVYSRHIRQSRVSRSSTSD